MAESRPSCAVCGLGAHRYGTTDPEHEFNAMGCVNVLLHDRDQWKSLAGDLWSQLDSVPARWRTPFVQMYIDKYEQLAGI